MNRKRQLLDEINDIKEKVKRCEEMEELNEEMWVRYDTQLRGKIQEKESIVENLTGTTPSRQAYQAQLLQDPEYMELLQRLQREFQEPEDYRPAVQYPRFPNFPQAITREEAMWQFFTNLLLTSGSNEPALARLFTLFDALSPEQQRDFVSLMFSRFQDDTLDFNILPVVGPDMWLTNYLDNWEEEDRIRAGL